MVAATTTPPSAQPPPDVPPLPTTDPKLVDYLRRFSLWCRNGFTQTSTAQNAFPQLYFKSPGGHSFKVWINDSGLLMTTALATGTGKETTPVITEQPIVTANSSTKNRNAPTSASSSSYVMFGLGLTFSPSFEKQGLAIATGAITNSAVNGETDVVVCYGTGTAPAPGAALVGTIIGPVAGFIAPTAGASGTFTATGIAAPLASGSYWFDLAIRALSGSGSISSTTMIVSGLP